MAPLKIRKIYIILLFLNIPLAFSTHDSFSNECGSYSGEVDENPTSDECIGQSTGSSDTSIKCCYIEGEKDLEIKTACILVTDTQEKRIEAILEMSTIATGVKIDCGSTKEFPTDCGSSSPTSVSDCTQDTSTNGYDCCFIKIESEQYTGTGCKKYKNIDINTIGEAVVAAKTVGATLTVDCFGFYYKGIYSLILFSFLILVM